MNNNATIRLSLWLPILVFSAFSLLLSFFTIQEYRQDARDLNEGMFTSIRERLARSSERVEGLRRNGLDSLVAVEIAEFSISSEVRSVVLTDDTGLVLDGSQRGWQGHPALNAVPSFDRDRFVRAQQARRPDIRISPSGTEITAYQPVVLSAPSGQIRPTRVGMLYAVYDLSPIKAAQLNNLLAHNLVIWAVGMVLMLMLWFMLNRWLTLPLSYLKDIVHRYRGGDYAVRARISGTGELVELSAAFNAMADSVLRNSAQLQAVLNAATEYAIIATDLNGVVTVFNPGAERMIGYAAEEVIGKQTPLLWHLDAEISAKSEEFSKALGRPVTGFGVFSEFACQGKSLADT